MIVCNARDYKTAFNFLLWWLKESCDVVHENMPDVDDKVAFAKADGYLTCCSAAIVLAEKIAAQSNEGWLQEND